MVPVVPNCGIGKTLSQLEEHRRFDESRKSGEYGGDEVMECKVTANPVGDVWKRSVVLGLCCPKQAALGIGSTSVLVARDGGKSLCTVERLTDLFEQGVFPEDLAIMVPKPHRRPWNPPKGYICVYEDYFTDGQLRFPLPDFLVQYCFRRGIAFSQLSLGLVRNAVGLMMLGNDCGVEVDTDLFEEATSFSVMADNPGLCQVNARSSHKIVHGVKSKVVDWRRYYFYVQVSEISAPASSSSLATEWNLFPGRLYLDTTTWSECLHGF
ncbi:meiosis-specific protein ASY2-like [Arabidopsis lyrata subsp. lyrata]|uniref:meiosis-specific protein ASY2-like n=1 Tax=Arabidopsis lyrata subsp. lyrata TaxID=81972 RepID=UPI000A29CE98|nr:meiosis-specific protein ASY2-like [Arabidopsis lyrata subsp. lyrata]|eukprot:XP_020872110.1 meiosis-specific protein ASY2-like [Arabidopsis lyrata subsp. lyrata]